MSHDTHQLFGEIKVRMSSALIAKLRLKDIIAADRASVPCGRWMRIRMFGSAYIAWSMQNALAPTYKRTPPPPIESRPRYRWVIR